MLYRNKVHKITITSNGLSQNLLDTDTSKSIQQYIFSRFLGLLICVSPCISHFQPNVCKTTKQLKKRTKISNTNMLDMLLSVGC